MKNITKQNRRRSRVFRHKTRSRTRTRTRTQTRNSKKTNLRKKNKSRRGSYTKKRKVMVGGALLTPYEWTQLSQEQKQNIINSIEDINYLNTYSNYEEDPNNTDETIGNSIVERINILQQSSSASPPPPPPPPQSYPPQQPPPQEPPQQPPPPPQSYPPQQPPPQEPPQQPPPPPELIEIHEIPIEEEPIKENQFTPTISRRVNCDCKRRPKSSRAQVPESTKNSSRFGWFSRNKKNKVNPA